MLGCMRLCNKALWLTLCSCYLLGGNNYDLIL